MNKRRTSTSPQAATPHSRETGDLGMAFGQRLVALAKIGRPYGLHGAIHVYPFSAEAVALRCAKSVVIRHTLYEVESLRVHGDALIVQLAGIHSPEAAQKLTNTEMFVSRDAFPPLPKGEFYWVDLVGLICANGDREFGKVIEVIDSPAHPVLRVRADTANEASIDELIPFVDAIVRSVDLESNRIEVDWQGSE